MSKRALEGCRVLLVEDEFFIGLDIDHILTDEGAEIVGPINTVDQAMAEAKRDGFGLAVLDIRVHGGLTFDIADELMRHGVPFIFTTGYEPDSIPKRFNNIKRWTKPVDLLELKLQMISIFREAQAKTA